MNTKYILRVDNKYWRVKVRVGQEYYNRCFAFIKYGDEETALKQAVTWRDRILKKYGLIDRLMYKKSPHRFKNHPFGPVIGVYLNYNPSTDRWNWIARYSVNEKEVKKYFSVSKYGSHDAFRMACKTRYKHVGKLIVVQPDLMPCKPTVPFVYRPVSGDRPG